MTRITLAKALKLKNRLAGRIGKLQAEMQKYNSVLEGSESVDVNKLLEQLDTTVVNLTNLKCAISAANQRIQKDIFELAECKARMELLGGLSTRHGKFSEYGETPTTYVATIRKVDVDKMTATLEQRIDVLQDKLDKYNYATEIEISPEVLTPVLETKSCCRH